jgi:Putative DNA-binding domain
MSEPSPSALAALAHEQQQLLRALLGDRESAGLWPQLRLGSPAGSALAHRGLLAYRSHGLALAERALAAAYPVISQLVGADNFAPMARQFWRQQPPAQGDMACWGGELAGFIAAAPQLADEPFLADVARVEWALHQAATAVDSSPDLTSIALLTRHAPDALTLQLSPGTARVASAYPVVSLMKAHVDAPGEPDLTHAGELLRERIGEHALIWRHGLKPQVEAINQAESAFIHALLQAQSLAQALEAAAQSADAFDFSDWLARAVQGQLVTGAQLLSLSKTEPIRTKPHHASQ